MKRLFTALAAFAALIISWAITASAMTPISTQVIHGQVVNWKGKAVAGAKVYVYDSSIRQLEPAPATMLTTDKNGRFNYRLTNDQQALFGQSFGVVAKGYAVGAGSSEEGKPVKIVLWPEYKIKGKAVDEKNQPLAGATVSVVTYYAGEEDEQKYVYLPGRVPGAMQAAVQRDGSFVITGIPDPARFYSFRVELRVTGRGRAGVRFGFDKPDIPKGVTITVPPACVLEGVLRTPDRSTLPKGAKVRIQPLESPGWYERDTAVDAQGRFRVVDLPPGRLLISLTPGPAKMSSAKLPVLAAAPEWVLPHMHEAEAKPSEPARVELVLSRGAVIKGVATNKRTGKPLAGAVVGFTYQAHSERVSVELTSTDAEGRFEHRVPAGKVKVSLVFAEGEYVGPFEMSEDLVVKEGEEKSDVKFAYDPESAKTIPLELQPESVQPSSKG